VFGADFSPSAPTPTEVWVVDGTQPVAAAEHVAGGVAALAADTTTLYVANYQTVTGYDRTTGNQVGQWPMPHVNTANASNNHLVDLVAVGGKLWILVAEPDGSTAVYQLDPSSGDLTMVAISGQGAAIGPDGSLYYAGATHLLARQAPGGQVTTGPALADAPNGLGGGVQYIQTVAAGQVWVLEPAGQGLDAQIQPYDAQTLAPGPASSGTATEDNVTDTLAGPLVAPGSEGPGDCPTASTAGCVFRIADNGQLSDPTSVGSVLAFLGPYPVALILDPADTGLILVRLG
jgi:hypothetical protein